MFTPFSSRNVRGPGDDKTKSKLPGSSGVYVRDMDDVKDAFHGSYESPKLDSRADRGSLRWAMLATGAAIFVGIGALALLGWLSGARVNRTEIPNSVLTRTACIPLGDQVAFQATYDPSAGANVAALTEAEGLEIEIMLLDELGVQVDSQTVWLDFGPRGYDSPDAQRLIGHSTAVTFDEAVASPRCETTVWAA